MYFKIDLCKTLIYRAKFHNTFLKKQAAEDTFAYKKQSCRCPFKYINAIDISREIKNPKSDIPTKAIK